MEQPSTPSQPARRRGGQPGNSNALTHGFYSRAGIGAHHRQLIEAAREHGSLEDDIVLLRTEVARLVVAGAYDRRELAALCRAIAYHESIKAKASPKEQDELLDAIAAILAE